MTKTTVKNTLPAVSLLLSEARGIYIPRDFASDFDLTLWQGLENIDLEDLENPENDYYWGAWNDVLNSAEFHENGYVWRLHQDGDLWAYCFELMTQEEKQNFGFEE